MIKNQKGFVIQGIIAVIALLILAGGAYVILQKQKESNSIQNTPSTNPQNNVSQPPASDWKTYRNLEYGFEFQYPVKGYALDDKRATESAGFKTIASVYVSPPPIEFGANFSVGAKNAESVTTGIDAFARNLFGNSFINIEPVTINGTNWQKVRTKDDYFGKEVSVDYFTLYGNQLYRINYFPIGSPSQSDFEKILSSFKFTSGSGSSVNPTPITVTPSNYSISDWKTYTNAAYGFKANFPLGTQVKDVDVTGGRSLYVSFPTGNIPPFNFQFPSLVIQVQNSEYGRNSSTLVPVQSCTSDNVTATPFWANNINFLKADISGDFGGMESAAVAASYCVIQNGIRYTIIPKISYGRYQGTAPDKNKSFEQFDQIIKAIQFQLLPLSQPFISASTYLTNGENMTITGTNLDHLGAYPGIGWLTHSHVLAYLKNSSGKKGVLWEGGSQGGKQVVNNQIITTLPSKICMISEVGAGGCPADNYLSLIPGKYSLTVYVEGRGESNTVDITIH